VPGAPSIPRPLRNGWDTYKFQGKLIFSASPVSPSKQFPNLRNLRNGDLSFPIGVITGKLCDRGTMAHDKFAYRII
jgi:hypothetical protein